MPPIPTAAERPEMVRVPEPERVMLPVPFPSPTKSELALSSVLTLPVAGILSANALPSSTFRVSMPNVLVVALSVTEAASM